MSELRRPCVVVREHHGFIVGPRASREETEAAVLKMLGRGDES